MSIEKYIRKRNFSTTPEPDDTEVESFQHRFVIQRHDARRLHYDLRLEMEGVLRSWAIPKGPSMNPSDKRLAIHTEDHPIKYLNFEGTIPKGNYGAGEMVIWDQGSYNSYKKPGNHDQIVKEYHDGRLLLSFNGTRISGKFILLKTHGSHKDHWLLIKQQDPYAVNENYDAELLDPVSLISEPNEEEKMKQEFSLETRIQPMLATPTDQPFSDPRWLFELKYDGYRILANIQNHIVSLYSRNGRSYDDTFTKVVDNLRTLPHEAIMDGEMIVVNSDGHPRFQALQNYESDTTESILRYMVFDLLHLNGHSLMELPLMDRKELLQDIIDPDMTSVKFCDHVNEHGQSLYDNAVQHDLEGIIAKRADSLYYPGKRSEDWLKIKQHKTEDVVICGYTESDKPGRPFGSLILGQAMDGLLTYRGNCGTGFSKSQMDSLYAQFQSLKRKHSPFENKANLKGRTPQWMKPQLVCEIKYSECTSNGRFRHPVFVRMRPDKKRMKPKTAERNDSVNKVKVSENDIENTLTINNVHLSLSNLDKIYWPDTGLRKYDLLDYYMRLADTILPYLVDRPQNLHRHPNGINHPGFYQKNQEHLPDWVKSIQIYSNSSEKELNYLVCQDKATLLYLANLGCIEINPWLSKTTHLEYPDYAIIDLDPSDSNTFQQVQDITMEIKQVVDEIGVPAAVKTSGSKGIHVYIPLRAEYTYEQARDFARLICIIIHNRKPGITTMERSLRKRGPKIYLDYLQNRRGQTVVAPYSVRPVPGATVSAPVFWEELENGITMDDLNIKTVPDRVEKFGDLFTEILKEKAVMHKAIDHLARLL